MDEKLKKENDDPTHKFRLSVLSTAGVLFFLRILLITKKVAVFGFWKLFY